MSQLIDKQQLAYIMEGATDDDIELHLPFINFCMSKFEIDTPLRMQHFLAQCAHESDSLKYMREISSGEQYEGREDLGNTEPGDGKRFVGRGPIQITGRFNYTEFFNYIGRSQLINTPEILEQELALAWLASGWFWSVLKKINSWADKDNIEMVTKRVNGGLRGINSRKKYLQRAKEVIKKAENATKVFLGSNGSVRLEVDG